MKCPKCSHKQKVKYGLQCGGCGYEFTFNPKDANTRNLTDGAFLACVKAASRNNTSWFTENQLYAVFCRRSRRSPVAAIGCGIIAIIIGILLFSDEETIFPFALGALVIGILFIVGGLKSAGGPKVTPAQFGGILNRWRSSGKTIEKLIKEPSLHESPPDWSEPDIYDYGVERILIVERDLLVDLFVKNGVHAELRMLVLSESGYPEYLLPVARRLLSEQPDLPVFLLHDATPHGIAMELRVRANNLLTLEGHPVTDLGMFPDDFQKLKRTSHFDPINEQRALPVDAMLLPFMAMGLGAAMTEGMSLSSLIEEQQLMSASDAYIDFG